MLCELLQDTCPKGTNCVGAGFPVERDCDSSPVLHGKHAFTVSQAGRLRIKDRNMRTIKYEEERSVCSPFSICSPPLGLILLRCQSKDVIKKTHFHSTTPRGSVLTDYPFLEAEKGYVQSFLKNHSTWECSVQNKGKAYDMIS